MQSKQKNTRANISAAVKASFVVVFGTILHQSSMFEQLPVGSLLSLSLVLLIAIQIRTASNFRTPNVSYALVVLGLLFVFSQGFLQDKMIPANQAGLIWSYGASILAFVVAIWPRISSRQWQNKAGN